MGNKAVKIFFVIILIEILLVSYSFYYDQTSVGFIKKYIRFYTPKTLFDFSSTGENLIADSLLLNYLANTVSDDQILKRVSLSKIGPKKQNVFLTNPEIENPDGTAGKALDNFFRALQSEKDSAVIRIAHYGDSQLEGDRVSYVIRDKIHQKFGGSGIGYVPLKDLSPISYIRKSSGNWGRYSVFQHKHSVYKFGLSGLVCRFYSHGVRQKEDINTDDTSSVKDTQSEATSVVYRNASVSLKMRGKYKYNSISFLYGHNEGVCTFNIFDELTDKIVKSDTLPTCTGVGLHKLQTGPLLNVRVEFSAAVSPDFYGMYFDSRNGVQVDNYAIRGHSGDGLALIDDAQLREMLRLTNTRLVIFQYGANMVPYVRSEKACEWMSTIYYNLFLKFKKADPNISIVVVGAGDMAYESDGKMTSYLWLPKIVEAQKQAALKAGCAYWDLFNMMGGANSILTWADKNMAVTNGHFSGKGQEVVANELVEALMIEYNDFIHRTRKK